MVITPVIRPILGVIRWPVTVEELSYFLLGPLQVRRGAALVHIGGGKPLELLALLLVHRNRTLSTDALIDQLWEGRPPETATKIVQNAVSALRRAIGDGAESVLVTRGHGYELVAPHGATDDDRFATLLEQGRAELVDGRADRAVATLREALSLWRGAPLADVAYHAFARDEIARLEEQRLLAIEDRVDADLATGGGAGSVAELEQLVGEHPLRERLRGQLMLALYRSGRQARALEVYTEGRRELAEQLGIEPGEALKQLQRTILAHDERLAAPPPHRRMPAVRRRVSWGAFWAGAGLLAVTVVAATLLLTHSGAATSGIVVAAGNSVVLVDAAGNRVTADYPVGQTPTRLVASGDVAWSLNADDHTISRIDLANGRAPRTFSPAGPGVPVDLALGGGWLWVSEITQQHAGSRNGLIATLIQIDPSSLAIRARLRLPGTPASREVPLAYASGKVWAGGSNVVAIDPISMRIVARVTGRISASSLAVGLGSVWASAGGPGAEIYQINPASAQVVQRTVDLSATSAGPLTVAAGAVWMTDPSVGTVLRIDPGPPLHMTKLQASAGAGAVGIAAEHNTVWAASALNGTVTRINATGDPAPTHTIGIGGIPQAVAVTAKGVLVSVAGGDGLQAASTSKVGITSVPGMNCGPVIHGSEDPRLLIVADLPITGSNQPTTLPMSQAIVYALRTHDFHAGRYPIGFQQCDDVSGATGEPDPTSCRSSAAAYARTVSVVGMIGPFTSLCAVAQLALLNRAGPLAVVSPSNSRPGLTHAGPGEAPNEPATYRPSGVLNYLRVIPGDDLQGVAAAALAHTLGLRRVYVYRSTWYTSDYPTVVGDAFTIAARTCGIHVTPPTTPNPSQIAAVVSHLKASGVDGIFVSGGTQLPNGGTNRDLEHFLEAARSTIPGLKLLGDAGLSTPLTPQGMYIATEGIRDPAVQLPTSGAQFVHEFGLTQAGGEVSPYSANAAQAADVLLTAIAHSDGTRLSVTHALLNVHITNGILGSFSFDRNGDMTNNLIPVIHNGQLTEVLQITPGNACP